MVRIDEASDDIVGAGISNRRRYSIHAGVGSRQLLEPVPRVMQFDSRTQRLSLAMF
jgi:hypothetical protein